ncbi:hypothetical protein [Mycetocola zhadangensis]|uniref:hypothetical protein n=1 Tax=Mycetocola zhadangensis TaxID=1164595 RepID=UPI0011C3DBD3|nr:hypothetical protein [Mycetocola zhadangensis]
MIVPTASAREFVHRVMIEELVLGVAGITLGCSEIELLIEATDSGTGVSDDAHPGAGGRRTSSLR